MLSVLLPTFNNAKMVRDCLESVKWADEILVVDSYSRDATLEICREYGARIVQHQYINSARQKNWAIPQCAHEWVLQIDTDEVLEEGASDEIRSLLSAEPSLDAFRLPRKNFIYDQPLRVANLYPDYQIRLFRRATGRFEDKQVHAHVQVPGQVGTLQHHILHHGMPNLTKQLSNLDRYSRYQADQFRKQGKRFHWYQLALRPVAIFLYYYVWKRSFIAGYRGLWIAAVDTTFDFWSHAKLWEIETLELTASPQ